VTNFICKKNLHKTYFYLTDKFANGLMENFLKKLKDIMKTGNSSLGIPVLDPFIADQLTLNLNEEPIKCVPFQFFSIKRIFRLHEQNCKAKYLQQFLSLSSFFIKVHFAHFITPLILFFK